MQNWVGRKSNRLGFFGSILTTVPDVKFKRDKNLRKGDQARSLEERHAYVSHLFCNQQNIFSSWKWNNATELCKQKRVDLSFDCRDDAIMKYRNKNRYIQM
jgi:hypothetical protein